MQTTRRQVNSLGIKIVTSLISTKLDKILSLYEAKGYWMSDTLLPGLSETQIRDMTEWFPATLCSELIEMYMWRNGQSRDAKYPFWFRDTIFQSVGDAKDAYYSTLKIYAEENVSERDGIDILKCFPFAEFEGECYVLPCVRQTVNLEYERPVMTQAGEIYFHSIGAMLDTVLEWISHSDYEIFNHLPREVELAIWHKHNPGIFS